MKKSVRVSNFIPRLGGFGVDKRKAEESVREGGKLRVSIEGGEPAEDDIQVWLYRPAGKKKNTSGREDHQEIATVDRWWEGKNIVN